MRVAASGCSDSVLDLSALFLERREKWKHVNPLFLGVKRDFFPLTFLFSWGWEENGGGVGYFSQRAFEGTERVVLVGGAHKKIVRSLGLIACKVWASFFWVRAVESDGGVVSLKFMQKQPQDDSRCFVMNKKE
jgi:hypothetical protein